MELNSKIVTVNYDIGNSASLGFNVREEFQAYGLSKTTMIVVGIFKVLCAILLLLGIKYEKLITPAAFVMATFMLAAIYFHVSISDPFIPTLPSSLMLLSCIAIIFLDKKVNTA